MELRSSGLEAPIEISSEAGVVQPARRVDLARVAPAVALVLNAVVLLRTAWVSDDALISFRCVENFVHGYGPVFNVGERVQAFTHPLWFLLLSAAWELNRHLYITSIAVSLACTLGALATVLHKPGSRLVSLLLVSALAGSQCFVDFGTSGLENPLAYLLFGLLVRLEGRPSRKRLTWMALLTACIFLTRADLTLLAAPLVLSTVVEAWRLLGRRAVTRSLLLGAIPAVGWVIFSIVYYGFPWPNTAYAKLLEGVPRSELVWQGLTYVVTSLGRDPIGALLLGAFVATAAAVRDRRLVATLTGVSLYLGYVVVIGGDFMAGRFLAVPLFLAAATMARLPLDLGEDHAGAWLFPLALVLAGVIASRTSDSSYANHVVPASGIADERGYWYQQSGLLARDRSGLSQEPDWPEQISPLHDLHRVCAPLGRVGLDNPGAYIIDQCALSDPLLARMPAVQDSNWRVGHFARRYPQGYDLAIRLGTPLSDPKLEVFASHLAHVTRGSLFSLERWKDIVAFNLGRYDALIDRDCYRGDPLRDCTDQPLLRTAYDPALLGVSRAPGTGWDDGETIVLTSGIDVTFPVPRHATTVSIGLDSNDRYTVEYRLAGRRTLQVTIGPGPGPGLASYDVRAPADLFDEIIVRPASGDGSYSVGHIIPR